MSELWGYRKVSLKYEEIRDEFIKSLVEHPFVKYTYEEFVNKFTKELVNTSEKNWELGSTKFKWLITLARKDLLSLDYMFLNVKIAHVVIKNKVKVYYEHVNSMDYVINISYRGNVYNYEKFLKVISNIEVDDEIKVAVKEFFERYPDGVINFS